LPSILDLDLETLKARGIDGLILDLDNTVVPYGHPLPSDEVAAHLKALLAGGVRAVILSNARSGRAAEVAAALGLPYIANAGKPGLRGFARALSVTGTDAARTAVVGDQLFRDVLGARRAGCHAILVHPLSPRDFPGTKLLRWPEALLVRYFKRIGRWPGQTCPF
jgi:HAD superfamily phosphatase (TIGR01668 family)